MPTLTDEERYEAQLKFKQLALSRNHMFRVISGIQSNLSTYCHGLGRSDIYFTINQYLIDLKLLITERWVAERTELVLRAGIKLTGTRMKKWLKESESERVEAKERDESADSKATKSQ